jgi:hypothetical protein
LPFINFRCIYESHVPNNIEKFNYYVIFRGQMYESVFPFVQEEIVITKEFGNYKKSRTLFILIQYCPHYYQRGFDLVN